VCPTEEDLGMFMLSLFIVMTCGDWVRGPNMGKLTLSMGPARAEVRSYVQRATIPSKRAIHSFNIH
jgi:hypothetical protein